MDELNLAELLGEHAARHVVPGAALGVFRGGRTMLASHGVADVATAVPVTAETRFSTGSLTKPMVATVIARLVRSGGLSLDDPLAAHLDLPRAMAWAERATVRDLMANRSGLALRASLEFGFADHQDQDAGALSRLAAEASEPPASGTLWSYSNFGWCLLGRLIETVTGLDWEAAMHQYLFEPAGMTGTTFATDAEPSPHASGHGVSGGVATPAPPVVSRAYGPAGASVLSTITDLLRFAAMHLEDSSLADLRTSHSEVAIHAWLDGWGLGWARFDWAGGEVWGWDGLIGGERSVMRLVPEHKAAVVLLTNASTGRAMYRDLYPVLMREMLEVVVPALALEAASDVAGDLSRYAGRYAWPDRQVTVIAAAGGGLTINSADSTVEASPIDDRVFLVDRQDPDNPTMTFGSFDAHGRPGVLYDMLWGLPRVQGSD